MTGVGFYHCDDQREAHWRVVLVSRLRDIQSVHMLSRNVLHPKWHVVYYVGNRVSFGRRQGLLQEENNI